MTSKWNIENILKKYPTFGYCPDIKFVSSYTESTFSKPLRRVLTPLPVVIGRKFKPSFSHLSKQRSMVLRSTSKIPARSIIVRPWSDNRRHWLRFLIVLLEFLLLYSNASIISIFSVIYLMLRQIYEYYLKVPKKWYIILFLLLIILKIKFLMLIMSLNKIYSLTLPQK